MRCFWSGRENCSCCPKEKKNTMTIPIKNTTLKNAIANAVLNLTTKKTMTVITKRITTPIVNVITIITKRITTLIIKMMTVITRKFILFIKTLNIMVSRNISGNFKFPGVFYSIHAKLT